MALLDQRPDFAEIPSPADRSQLVKVRVDPSIVTTLAAVGRMAKLFELFYNVAGMPPPVPHIGFHEAATDNRFPDHWGGLRGAQALFKGVERPVSLENTGEAVYVYVLHPRYVYRRVPHMVCMAKRVDAPQNAAFVVYARFDSDFEAGTVLNWEWVRADLDSGILLPENLDERYAERVW